LKAELKKNNFMMLCFSVAKELGFSLSRLLNEMTVTEIIGWSVYYEICNDETKKAMER
jgi:hypothetical protein